MKTEGVGWGNRGGVRYGVSWLDRPFAVIIIDVESDTPGIRNAYGPYTSHNEADNIREICRENFDGNPELVQTIRLTP